MYIQDSTSSIEQFFTKGTGLLYRREDNLIYLYEGTSHKNYKFILELTGSKISSFKPRRGFTTPEERSIVRDLVQKWNSEAPDRFIPENEIETLFKDLDKEKERCEENGLPLTLLVGYRNLNVNIVQVNDHYDWIVAIFDRKEEVKGSSDSYENLEPDLREAINELEKKIAS